MSEHTNDNGKQDAPAGENPAGDGGENPAGDGAAETPAPADIPADAGATESAPGDAPEAANDAGEETPAEEPADPQAARIAELETELATLKDSALRAMAEAENVRKRAEKQVQDASRYGASAFARDMLVVADNLERALVAVPDGDDGGELLTNLREGVQMTLRDLLAKLEAHNVRKVEPALGEKFDHNHHQAMFEMETEEYPAGTIAQVAQPGYTLHDRLLRAAMVGVAKAPAAPADDEAAAASDPAETNETGNNNAA